MSRCLVTGSTRGIGGAIAEALAAQGHDLVLSARSAEELEEQATALAGRFGIKAVAVPADLADSSDVERLASQALAAFGGLDVLVNNAGVSYPKPVVELETAHWQSTIAVNLTAACLLAARVGASMADVGGGRIVNIASAAGRTALRDHYAYSVSKAGLLMATRVLALELGPRGVRANALCPTVVMTEMGQRVWGDVEKAKPLLDRIPAGRFAQPEDVTAALLYLLSPGADMLNGVELSIDGGYAIA
jgi:NAD(P)-dependent dehydrogenase (short-subunit alcohol dehydrogenase family)